MTIKVYDKDGKAVSVSNKEAEKMLNAGTHSMLYPKGNTEQEKAAYKAAVGTVWVYDRDGRRVEATIENAKGMVSEGGGFSTLFPRGTPEEEAAEFEALTRDQSPADAVVRASRRGAPVEAPRVIPPTTRLAGEEEVHRQKK